MDGVAMGGSIAGPYGAAAGLVLGAFYGLATADSHYEQINAQIQSEQTKDKELEAQIEREIEHQRELEAQLGKAENPPEPKKTEEIQIAQRTIPETKNQAKVEGKKEEPTSLASIGKKESSPVLSSPFKNVEVRDTNGDGIPDLWIYYDTSRDGEIVIKEERDLNGDGVVDLWTYYENGRVVRRDVSAVGLEILSKQEQLPVPTAGIRQLATPGS